MLYQQFIEGKQVGATAQSDHIYMVGHKVHTRCKYIDTLNFMINTAYIMSQHAVVRWRLIKTTFIIPICLKQ